jgi:hypothetical protein
MTEQLVGPALHTRPVHCARPGCRDSYAAHVLGGELGECAVCTCHGFLWVPPAGPVAHRGRR